jgi:hypothetical protein
MSGVVDIGIRLSDGELRSEVGTISITIIAENDHPLILGSLAYTMSEDGELEIASTDIQGVYLDEETVELNGVKIVSLSHTERLNGTLYNGSEAVVFGEGLVAETLELRYVPSANESGSVEISYRVSDGELESESGVIHIVVDSVPDSPQLRELSRSKRPPSSMVLLNSLS